MNKVELPLTEIKNSCNDLENNIITMYLNRFTQKKICSTLNIKRGKIDTLVKKYNLTRFRDRKLSYCTHTDINNPEFWYFLGLFASDGNLYLKSNQVNTIQFTLDDKEALVCVKNIIGCNNEVKCYIKSKKPRYYLSVSDTVLIKTVQQIFNSSCYRKTFNLKFPIIKNKVYLSMFLRGFFDGDGSFTKSRIKGFYNFRLYCASKDFILSLYNILKENLDIKVHLYKDAYIDVSSQKEVYKLCKFIYQYKPLIGIKRKYDRAFQHIKNYELKI